jgi:hypothetical protein
MVDLNFTVQDVEVERHAVSPLLKFAVRLTSQTADAPVLNVMLNCQIRIEPTRRIYGAAEHDMLSDLFGAPERWGQTLQTFLWTHSNILVPAFERECVVKLPVPCNFDFNIAATKYFHGIQGGDIPLIFLFSGSVFYRDASDNLQIGQIAWTKESSYRLPVQVWRAMMDHYYPQTAWLCLRRDAFEQLYRYKRARALPSFETALTELLDAKLTSATS